MSRIFIIARLEFVKFVTRRGFLFTLIGVPIWIGLASVLPVLLASGADQSVFTVLDSNGAFRPQIAQTLAREDAWRDLSALSDYAGDHADLAALKRAEPQTAALLADPSRAPAVTAFQKAGGWHAVFAALSPYLKAGSPSFDPPKHPFVMVDPPDDLAAASAKGFAATARFYLNGGRQVATGGGVATLDAIVVVPRDFGERPAEFWSTHSQRYLQGFVQSALTVALRLRAAHRLADPGASAALDTEADLARHDPSLDKKSAVAAEGAIAVAVGAAILMFIVSLMNSMALLQGIVEEKSTRMIEVLLSCATPWEIVAGKIAGIITVALFTVFLWVAAALLLAMSLMGEDANSILGVALHALADPGLLAMIFLYFMCGLLIYGALFLSIGSMSASLADAQSYLGPSIMLLMVPNLLISEILRAPNGTLATVVSYVPIYTPYIMLLRVGSHPPVIELIATALLAVGAAAFLIWKAGDIFARHALTTERPPALGALFAGLRARLPGR